MDEMWSYVFSKSNPRWLWLALDHQTGRILAYTFGTRKDEVFYNFQELLMPFKITVFYTDDWGSYERNIPATSHVVGKKNTQTIERKILPFGPESNVSAEKPYVFPNQKLCMISSLGW